VSAAASGGAWQQPPWPTTSLPGVAFHRQLPCCKPASRVTSVGCCLPLLREKLDEDQEVLRQLRKQLAAAELAAEAATGSAAAAGTSSAEAERLQEEAAALRQRWLLAEAELSASQQECNAVVAEAQQLRQQLQQRDSEVAQLRLQVSQQWQGAAKGAGVACFDAVMSPNCMLTSQCGCELCIGCNAVSSVHAQIGPACPACLDINRRSLTFEQS
jgi:hypothetical protein